MAKFAQKPIGVVLLCDLPLVAGGLQWMISENVDSLCLGGLVGTATEAVKLLARTPADVLLLDLDGDNGVGAIPELIAASKARVLAITASRDVEKHDAAILAGASGVFDKRQPVEVLLKAIEKVCKGELWIDRSATERILMSVVRQKANANPEHEKITQLTRKERLTVAEVTRDASASSRDIAERLHISEHTLRNHLSSIYVKLGVSGRVALYAYAQKYSLAGRSK
jgi:two-component system, NarL family, nitrate/nitrite response regulator NarL